MGDREAAGEKAHLGDEVVIYDREEDSIVHGLCILLGQREGVEMCWTGRRLLR